MPITVTPTAIPEVLIIEPKVFGDHRGYFFESFNSRDFAAGTGLDVTFVQDNHARSVRGVLRGLHYQMERPQGKLVRVSVGEVFDVAVDMRGSSPTFGRWVGVRLSAENRRQLWVPPGFAHGYVVLSDAAEFQYKTTDFWYAALERAVRWDDETLGIEWPISEPPTLAARDSAAPGLADAPRYE
jgi:dTDP-4-dehydrorhamnose 3,5-epimerase